MPQTNTELKRETRSDLPADVPRPGCLYTGPTTITFETVSGVPKMRVISPWTKKTNVTGRQHGHDRRAQCGTPGNVHQRLGSPTGALLDVLERNLIYVQAVPPPAAPTRTRPATGVLPPNFTCTDRQRLRQHRRSRPAGSTRTARTVRREVPDALGRQQREHPERWRRGRHSSTTTAAPATSTSRARSAGQITVAAENYIYVTGDLTYSDKATDILGLVGQNAVFVWNPVRYSGSSWVRA